MKKVVITGASSMLGLATIDECIKHNIEVLAIVRLNSARADRIPDSPLVHVAYCELEKMAQFEEFVLPMAMQSGNEELVRALTATDYDVFYHFAWGSTSHKGRNDVHAQNANVVYTIDAIRLASKFGCKRFIGAGSQAEYGLKNMEKIGPETITHPVTPYGKAKLMASHEGKVVAEELGMNFVWTRVFSVYGEYDGENTLISSMIRKLTRGEKTSFTAGGQIWDYLYSEDAGRAFYLLGESCHLQQDIYCLGSGSAQHLADYIREVRDIIKPGLSDDELGLGEIPYPKDCVMNICADIEPLTRDTGWKPSVTFAQGIQKIIEKRNME